MARRVLNHCVGGSLFCGSPCCGSPCCGSLCCGSPCCGYPVVVHCVVVTLLWVNVPTPPQLVLVVSDDDGGWGRKCFAGDQQY